MFVYYCTVATRALFRRTLPGHSDLSNVQNSTVRYEYLYETKGSAADTGYDD